MQNRHLILMVLMAALLSACASRQVKTVAAPASRPPAKEISAKETIPAKEVIKTEEPLVDSNIIGRPLPGGKFSRLKIGMTLKQVEKLIGSPNRQWKHPGEKPSISPSHDSDHGDIQYSYTHEGVLTFSHDEEPLLTRILVNRVE